jgi:hypothetical protein
MCHSGSSAWWLLICLNHAARRWLPSQTKNILPDNCFKSGSAWSSSSKDWFALSQHGLQSALTSYVISDDNSSLLYIEMYMTRSPSRYPFTNSRSRCCILISPTGLTLAIDIILHKGTSNRDFFRGWNRTLLITLMESTLCCVRCCNSLFTAFVKVERQDDVCNTSCNWISCQMSCKLILEHNTVESEKIIIKSHKNYLKTFSLIKYYENNSNIVVGPKYHLRADLRGARM